MNEPVRTTGLVKRYADRTVVASVDLVVRSGEVFGFLGPNGAGKTTTLRMLVGLVKPTAGAATVLGMPAWHPAGLARTGTLIEAPAFYPYLSGRDNLRALARRAGVPNMAADAALDQVGLVLRKRPACWVLLAAWLVLDLVFAYLLPLIGYASGQGRPAAGLPTAEAALRSTLPDQLVPNALGGMAIFGGVIAVIFGALNTGGDYALGTVKTALLQRHGRVTVAAAKLGAVATATLFTVVVTMTVGTVTSLAVAWSTGRPTHWPAAGGLVLGFLAGWLVLTMWALFGAVLGYLIRGVALPIGLGLVWVMAVENLIANVLTDLVSWLRPVRDLLPAANSASFVGGSILLVRSRDLP
jgi:ABC-2 type transport system permease protein